MNIKEIKDENSTLISQLLKVWEDSIKSTQLFIPNDANGKVTVDKLETTTIYIHEVEVCRTILR